MKKSVMKKMMAGLCAAAMLTTCSMGVFAEETNVVEETNIIELDPSEEAQQRGDTEVIAEVVKNDHKPDYIITIPQVVDFGTLKQPTTDANAYVSKNITVKCTKAQGLAAGEGIAVLVKDRTAASASDPFKLQKQESDCSLVYEMYNQNSNVQDGNWYDNGFLFITFTSAGQEHTNQLRLNLNQLYGKDINTWGGAYLGTLNFYTKIVVINAQ